MAVAPLSHGASAEEIGNWDIVSAHGYTEYSVGHGPGNSVLLSCDEGVSGEGETKNTNVFITIAGKKPPPNSQVQVFLDGRSLQLSTDARGVITTGCRSCSDNFAYLWAKIRKSHRMIVSLTDGRTSEFVLNGAAKALPVQHCTTGFKS